MANDENASPALRLSDGLGGLLDEAANTISALRALPEVPALDEDGFSLRLNTLARRLRAAARYHRVNPLGGPARMFDAIAARLRAGEAWALVLADYGLTQSPTPSPSKVYIQCPRHRNSPWPMMKVGYSSLPVETCPNCELANETPNAQVERRAAGED